MKVHAIIQQWGNSLALRISGAMREIPHFQAGSEVEVDITEAGLNIIKASTKTRHFPFQEKDLIKSLTPKTAHADLLARPLDSELGE